MSKALKSYILATLLAACVFGMTSFSVIAGIGAKTTPTIYPGEPETGYLVYGAPVGVNDTYSGITGESFNLLLVGLDWQPSRYADYNPSSVKRLFGTDINGTDTGAYRRIATFAATLVRVDKERGQITYTVIPRDMIIKAEGNDTTFGFLFEQYGIEHFVSRVEALTGITVDRYASVTAENFVKLTDLLGGVKLNLPVTMNFDGYTVKEGENLINGQTALDILLFDKYGNGVVSGGTTKETVASVFVQAFTDGLFSSDTAVKFNKITGYIYRTNITISDIEENAALIAASTGFEHKNLSIRGQYRLSGENTYYFPDITATLELFSGYRKIYD